MTPWRGLAVAVIGARGFIGARLVRALVAAGAAVTAITRDGDAADWRGRRYAVAFFCAGNSAPHLSAREPLLCLERSVADLARYLEAIDHDLWVQLSTTAVYPAALPAKREDVVLDPLALDFYGAHKLLAELYVRRLARRALLVRPGYLYGPGLRKNLLHDLRHGRTEIFQAAPSRLRLLHVDDLVAAILALAAGGAEGTVNVASRHVLTVGEILALKPGERQMRGERLIDEAAVEIARLAAYWREPRDLAAHLGTIRAYLDGAEDA